MSKCRGCGSEIRWIGKIPCNPLQVAYWKKPGARGKVVTPSGDVVSCDFDGDPRTATGLGYVAHWATCPAAGQFRRRGR